MLRYADFLISSFTVVNSGIIKSASLAWAAPPEEFLEIPFQDQSHNILTMEQNDTLAIDGKEVVIQDVKSFFEG